MAEVRWALALAAVLVTPLLPAGAAAAVIGVGVALGLWRSRPTAAWAGALLVTAGLAGLGGAPWLGLRWLCALGWTAWAAADGGGLALARRADPLVAVHLAAADLGALAALRAEVARLRRGRRTAADLGVALAGALTLADARATRREEVRELRRASPAGEARLFGRLTRGGLGIELALAPGERVLVLGASGAGKTSLLRAFAGLDPFDGTRSVGEVGWLGPEPLEQLLGATAADEARWTPRARGLPDADARGAAALAALGVAHLADRPVLTLSTGERRRVALAGVLAGAPSLLLCDEPTSGLDPRSAREVVHAVDALPAAVLWATHDPDRRPTGVRRAVLLADGRATLLPIDEALARWRAQEFG